MSFSINYEEVVYIILKNSYLLISALNLTFILHPVLAHKVRKVYSDCCIRHNVLLERGRSISSSPFPPNNFQY